MVAEARTRGMTGPEIGSFLGRCTLVNGIVAAASGVASDAVVGLSGTYKSPFVVSGLLLVSAGALIKATWSENYGGSGSSSVVDESSADFASDVTKQRTLWRALAVLKSSELSSLLND
jgi:hypothetical protein